MVLDLLASVIKSRALYTAAEFNIAEYLEAGPLPLNILAEKTGAHPQTLKRLLNFLCLHKVFQNNSDDTYSLPSNSSMLLAHHPQTIKPFLLHDDPARWNCFGNLSYSIKTGKPAFDMLYHQDYFSALKQDQELSKRFDLAMNIISQQEDAAIAKTVQLKGRVADIGGGNGQLARSLVAHQPSITQMIVFDLPSVTVNITPTATIQACGGSFFESLGVRADTFIAKRILHDWDDNQSLKILKNIHSAMEHDNELLIIEGLLDRGEAAATLAAIDLALLSIFGGQERTYAEFSALLSVAGFKIQEIQQITPMLAAIRCKKKL